jgi:hypothetical protein
MGAYKLMEGEVVSGRAVWQKQGGGEETFLYYSSDSRQQLVFQRQGGHGDRQFYSEPGGGCGCGGRGSI